jgi:hypothetical protein
MTCAAPPAYAFGTVIKFYYNGKSVVVKVNDRGGAIQGSHFDMARAPATALGMISAGSVSAQFEVLTGSAAASALGASSASASGTAPGGISGSGGTGTSVNAAAASPFYIGGSSNPNEDFWSGLNRIAQERQWYFFSDGETLYLADGADLMQQAPVLTLDRWADSDRILSLNFTWDNTAFQYTVNRKKASKRVVRKSVLQKVQSPVSGDLQVICDIDEVRAGDVIMLSGCGPGDGKWLVGDATRSVFDVFSDLTIVPAIGPLSEQEAAGGGTNAGSSTTLGTTISAISGVANAALAAGAAAGVGNVTAGVKSGTYAALNQPGLTTWSGHGNYHQGPITMCKWIANELDWAIDNGWIPQYPVTSGYRPGPDPHTATGASEHQGTSFNNGVTPCGAIDFGGETGDPVGEATKLVLIDTAKKLNYPGPRLVPPVGFIDQGHCSGNGG